MSEDLEEISREDRSRREGRFVNKEEVEVRAEGDLEGSVVASVGICLVLKGEVVWLDEADEVFVVVVGGAAGDAIAASSSRRLFASMFCLTIL